MSLHKMKLVHSTYELNRVKSILQEGLRPASQTGIYEYLYTQNSHVICFTALEELDNEHEFWGEWGIYHFILNETWTQKNKNQFREHGDEYSTKNFREFIRDLGLEPNANPSFTKRVFNQILSIKPVPVQGIETLVVPKSHINQRDIEVPEEITLKTY